MARDQLEQRAMAGDVAAQTALGRALLLEERLDEGEGWLRRAAEAGHVEAMADLGQYLFLGRPPVADAVLQESVRLTMQAANAGHAAAAHLAALIMANDPTIPDHWRYAGEYLTRAAMAGHALAQRELIFLSGDPDMPARLGRGETIAAEEWIRLRDMVDIAALTAVTPPRQLCDAPLIIAADNFLPPPLCDWIIRRARPSLTKSKVYARPGDAPVLRTCSEIEYPFPELDVVMMIVRQRLASLTGLSQLGMEPPSIIHYRPGEQFTLHYDYLNPEALAEEIARTGQCVATLLVYLNDDFDGGETHFPKIDLRYRGRAKGDAVIFRNVDADGKPDPLTEHAGTPPTRGEKWLLSQFVRNTRQANKLPGK